MPDPSKAPEKMTPEQIIKQEIETRKNIQAASSEAPFNHFKVTLRLSCVRDLTAKFGLHDDDPRVDQQYRLTAFAIEQELLRRLNTSK